MAELPAPTRRPFRFSNFELDPQSGELRRAGLLVRLQEQSFKVLIELVKRPGDLVTREHLRQRLWSDGTFVDVEHGLNAVVNRLRETLGDSADSPRLIQTVPRRGYRFIAPVEMSSQEVGDPGALETSADVVQPSRPAVPLLHEVPKARPGRSWWRVSAGATAIVTVVAAVAWRGPVSPPTPKPPMRLIPLTATNGSEYGHPRSLRTVIRSRSAGTANHKRTRISTSSGWGHLRSGSSPPIPPQVWIHNGRRMVAKSPTSDMTRPTECCRRSG